MEYASGCDRMDLCLRYGEVTLGIELKVWRTRKVDPLSKGLEQLDGYLARLGQDEGWLVIFDRRDNAPTLSQIQLGLSNAYSHLPGLVEISTEFSAIPNQGRGSISEF